MARNFIGSIRQLAIINQFESPVSTARSSIKCVTNQGIELFLSQGNFDISIYHVFSGQNV